MSGLNPQQREAIHYLDGPLLVLAGAGSGKTRVITQKIAYLVQDCGFQPRNVAAITFTNKAAKEMQERIGKILSKQQADQLQISTFHSLGVRILREEAKALGYKPRFSIFDSADCAGIISEVAKTVDKATLRNLQSIISNWKNALVSPEAARHLTSNDHEVLAAEAYLSYEATLKAYQAVDFDDLIGLPVKLFNEHPEIAEKWQNRLRYLLVDEYQDTNACQYQVLKLLTGVRQQFTAVGDDDQAIYGWRGADIENLKKLPNEFPALKVIKLEQNYRSTVRILKAANNVISHNEKLFDKKLWSELGHGEQITVTACRDNDAEAEGVVMKLQAHRFENRTKFKDYAILYRSNHQARGFEEYLRDHRIPYLLSGGKSFFDKAEIKDITAYLRLLTNEDDDPAFIRAATTPKRGIGAATLQVLGTYAGERHISLFHAAFEEGFAQRVQARQIEPLLEFCHFINRIQERAVREPAHQVLPDLLKAIDYETYLFDLEEERTAQTRWGNVCEFSSWLNKKGELDGKTLIDLTQSIALINLLDKQNDDEVDAVQLSTLHAAKGLEYKHVFLVGIEEGILPHRESVDPAKIEEERRLMYVGITRAQQSLYISYCERRKQAREFVPCEPSRFIDEMGKEDIRFAGGKQDLPPDKATGNARLDAMKAMLAGNKS
ncbi:UvrD-helicase domain-containing protein [Dechloromonas denitrificans]|uniref:UvrD-helicase domain-containing protein n=1 Tax=Dechloromonas denitrificans TaxID=281362 RepID=UPI001CF8C221|nr:UvrD-helicase domain-containing protein [Dechloromonas denitrificans]UCV03423.1 UvrD-helicase domain-containing protein [Dechloromonas denitrificans]UCV07682.1 UvrD-helicase domain-containing protein [Dechloromonas denitrificans]